MALAGSTYVHKMDLNEVNIWVYRGKLRKNLRTDFNYQFNNFINLNTEKCNYYPKLLYIHILVMAL